MSFTSWSFIAFVAALLVLYRVVPARTRPHVLNAGSLVFLATAGWQTLLTLVVCALITYGTTQCIARAKEPKARKIWLGTCVAANILLLLVARYARDNEPGAGFSWSALGLSFYVLQAIDCVVRVYRNDLQPRFLELLGYLAFFPKVPAGPIEPAVSFLSQVGAAGLPDLTEGRDAAKRILWGLFKKIVIADRLAALVAPVFAAPESYSGPAILISVYGQAIQIYCDFSGYCDIAIGVASLFGYRLSENFDKPYTAESIREFWHRWHITLTSWLKNHIYLPLGGNRVKVGAWCRNVLLVFLVSALWHGARATFLVWAGLHAGYYLIGRATVPIRTWFLQAISGSVSPALIRIIRVTFTFHLVAFAWIPFSASDLSHAGKVITWLCRDWTFGPSEVAGTVISLLGNLGAMNIVILCIALVVWIAGSYGRKVGEMPFSHFRGKWIFAEVGILDLILLLMLFSGEFAGTNFLYMYY